MPPPQQTHPLTKPKVVIGEGREDVLFFEALLAHLGLMDLQVEEYGGKDKLERYVREFGVRPGHQNVVALGITRDADDSVAQVFQSICISLNKNGLPVPSAPGQIAVGPPRVGVFILPDNLQNGMLEDLCLDAVQADGAMPCVTDFFQCVLHKAGRQPSPLAKARVHAWLASQAVPDLRLGEAAKKGYWPWDSIAFDLLRPFLLDL